MEHHSNQTSWLETIAEVQLIPHTKEGNIDLQAFKYYCTSVYRQDTNN